MAKKRSRGKINPSDLLAVIAGAAVAGKVGNLNLPINEKIKKVVPLGLGVFASMQKNQTIKMVGYGMTAFSGVKLIAEFVPSLGIGQGMDLGGFELEEINGPASNYALNGPGSPANKSMALAGFNDEPGMNTDLFG
jgi:hypothetical protein